MQNREEPDDPHENNLVPFDFDLNEYLREASLTIFDSVPDIH